MTPYTTIGVWNGDWRKKVIAIAQLRDEITNKTCVYTPKQLCDRRYSTCLQQFTFDPWTGEKLDWKQIKYFLEHGEFQGEP